MAKDKPERRIVKPNPDGGWDVAARGARRASAHSDTQAGAIARARTIVENLGGGVWLAGADYDEPTAFVDALGHLYGLEEHHRRRIGDKRYFSHRSQHPTGAVLGHRLRPRRANTRRRLRRNW